jgi:hypothetical protein
MVNRGAVILKYKDPFLKWISEADPSEHKAEITAEDANQERTVYLISDEDAENVDGWIRENYETLFEAELEGWYTDEALWPRKRNHKVFMEWFDVECHSVILDTVGGDIYDDEI